MLFKKLLVLLPLAVICIQAEDVAPATKLESKFKLIGDITLSTGVTFATINDIVSGSNTQAGDVETDPIKWGSLKATLLPNSIDLGLSYSKTFNDVKDTSNDVSKDTRQNSSEQFKASLPILDFAILRYNKYAFNSSFTATKQVDYVDRSNISTSQYSVLDTDPGITVINPGQTVGANINSTRYEVSFLNNLFKNFNLKSSVGVFSETLEKPWSDTTMVWKNSSNQEIAMVYKAARFENKGLTFGVFQKDQDLDYGFSLTNFAFDIAKTDITLTDHYNFDNYYGYTGGVSCYKLSLDTEVAYKAHTRFFGDKSNLLFAMFMKWDSYDASRTNNTNGQPETAALSDDFIYGIRASLVF